MSKYIFSDAKMSNKCLKIKMSQLECKFICQNNKFFQMLKKQNVKIC